MGKVGWCWNRAVGMARVCRLLVMCAVLVAAVPLPAQACDIDGIASISADGILAVRTLDPPTAALNLWAPFTVGLAVAPGDSVRFGEDGGKLRQSLPAATLAVPFRWEFGDGYAARGMAAAHRYSRTGWFKLTVRGYWPSRRAWLIFDSARVHVLPARALWQANAGYRVVLGLAVLTRMLEFGGVPIIFGLPIVLALVKRRRRSRTGVNANTDTVNA